MQQKIIRGAIHTSTTIQPSRAPDENVDIRARKNYRSLFGAMIYVCLGRGDLWLISYETSRSRATVMVAAGSKRKGLPWISNKPIGFIVSFIRVIAKYLWLCLSCRFTYGDQGAILLVGGGIDEALRSFDSRPGKGSPCQRPPLAARKNKQHSREVANKFSGDSDTPIENIQKARG